jgi:hypothetical protein
MIAPYGRRFTYSYDARGQIAHRDRKRGRGSFQRGSEKETGVFSTAALHQEVCCLSKTVVNTLVLSRKGLVHFCRSHRARQSGKRMLGKGMFFRAEEHLAWSNRQFGSNFRHPDFVPIRLPAIRLPSTCSPVSHPPATDTMLPRTRWSGILGEVTTG